MCRTRQSQVRLTATKTRPLNKQTNRRVKMLLTTSSTKRAEHSRTLRVKDRMALSEERTCSAPAHECSNVQWSSRHCTALVRVHSRKTCRRAASRAAEEPPVPHLPSPLLPSASHLRGRRHARTHVPFAHSFTRYHWVEFILDRYSIANYAFGGDFAPEANWIGKRRSWWSFRSIVLVN